MNKSSKKNELILYLLFGGLTTLVNIATYFLAADIAGIDYKLATTISWLAAVLFAYVTNKIYVFKSKGFHVKELLTFIVSRLLSYLLDIGTMVLLIEVARMDDLLAKIAANVLVVIFNYVASKYFIFVNRSDEVH